MEGPVSDAVLVQRAQRGDDDAFELLYARHRSSVERVCRRWLRDSGNVDDAVQETFLKAWRGLPRCRIGITGAGPWLRQIARNHCHDLWRSRPLVELGVVESDHAEAADPATLHLAGDCADRVAMQSVLRKLGQRDAALLVQRHIADAAVGDMAQQWGLTRASMDVALHRARVRARGLASAEGLRSLLPVSLVRRVVAFMQRLADVPPDMAAVLSGVAQIAVVATLALQPVQSAYADPVPPGSNDPAVTIAQARAAESALMRARRSLQSGGINREHADTAERTSPTPTRNPAADGTTTAHQDPSAGVQQPAVTTLRYEPVRVPATGSRVEQRPPDSAPNRAVGVRGGPAGHYRVTLYEVEPEATDPVADAACGAANVANPVAYCDD